MITNRLNYYKERILQWGKANNEQSWLICLISCVIGIICALSAQVLKFLVESFRDVVGGVVANSSLNYLYLVIPILGIFIARMFVKYIVKDDIGHGVTKILYAMVRMKSYIKSHNMWSSVVASSITIGAGGSVGAEAPIVLTGSAIGSNLGRWFGMNNRTLMILVGCGASAAVAGIFKAPITGVVFTLEVLLIDMTMSNIVPILISSLTATIVTYTISGFDFMFGFTLTDPFITSRAPFYVLLGVVCGLVSIYFIKGSFAIEGSFKKIKSDTVKLLVGGIPLSLLIFLIPPFYGEGYNTIALLLDGNLEEVTENSVFYAFRDNFGVLIVFLFLMLFLKIFACTFTNCAGGTGGIFAPSLFVGCVTGYTMAMLINYPHVVMLPEKNFALAGMAGVMAGVMHAPLTGTFLIAELTGGYGMFIQLLITSTVAFITVRAVMPHSLYAQRLHEKGELLTHDKDRSVLTLMSIDDIVQKADYTLSPKMFLSELVHVISKSNSNIFAVVNDKGVLMGVISLDEVRNIIFKPELYGKFQMTDLMTWPSVIVDVNDDMNKVMLKFMTSGSLVIPVVQNLKFVGFISKSVVFNQYRNLVKGLSSE